MIIAILIGRKKSKGLPGKNTYKLMGKPLAWYAVNAAKNCEKINKIFLSTDDEKLKKFGNREGLEIIKRPHRLCSDKALCDDVFAHAFNYIRKQYRQNNIELIVLLMCNAVAVLPDTITQGINILEKNIDYDSAVTVSRYNMFSPLRARRIDSKGLLRPFINFQFLRGRGKMNCNRDCQGDVWFADMGVSIVRPRCLENLKSGLLPQRWMGRKIYPLKQYAVCDIDYEWQIPQAQYWLRKHSKEILG